MKEGKKMKKAILFGLVGGLIMVLSFSVAAKKEFEEPLQAPTNFTCMLIPDYVQFSWQGVDGALKYAIDVEMVLTNPGFEGQTIELDFNTADRDDGEDPTVPFLTVHASDFSADLDSGGIAERLYGQVTARVKAMNPPGKGSKRQNNPFSNECNFELPLPPT
jgi:hypothetical protein